MRARSRFWLAHFGRGRREGRANAAAGSVLGRCRLDWPVRGGGGGKGEACRGRYSRICARGWVGCVVMAGRRRRRRRCLRACGRRELRSGTVGRSVWPRCRLLRARARRCGDAVVDGGDDADDNNGRIATGRNVMRVCACGHGVAASSWTTPGRRHTHTGTATCSTSRIVRARMIRRWQRARSRCHRPAARDGETGGDAVCRVLFGSENGAHARARTTQRRSTRCARRGDARTPVQVRVCVCMLRYSYMYVDMCRTDARRLSSIGANVIRFSTNHMLFNDSVVLSKCQSVSTFRAKLY